MKMINTLMSAFLSVTVLSGSLCLELKNEKEQEIDLIKTITVYYLRHGESEVNVKTTEDSKWKNGFDKALKNSMANETPPSPDYAKYVDSILTDKGLKDALDARNSLDVWFKGDQDQVAFMSSPLRRAYATMAIAGTDWLSSKKNTPVYVHNSLCEVGPSSPSSNTQNDYPWAHLQAKDQGEVLTSYLESVSSGSLIIKKRNLKNDFFNFKGGSDCDKEGKNKNQRRDRAGKKKGQVSRKAVEQLCDDMFTIANRDSKNTFIIGAHSLLMQRIAEFASESSKHQDSWGLFVKNKLDNGAILKFDVTYKQGENNYSFSAPELVFKDLEKSKKEKTIDLKDCNN